jgi:hypothetical protein
LAVLISNEKDDATGTDQSTWVLVTSNAELLASPMVKVRQQAWPDQPALVFTDAYSNLYQLLR